MIDCRSLTPLAFFFWTGRDELLLIVVAVFLLFFVPLASYVIGRGRLREWLDSRRRKRS